MKYSPFFYCAISDLNILLSTITPFLICLFFCWFGTFLLLLSLCISHLSSSSSAFFVAPQLHLCLFCINCSSLRLHPSAHALCLSASCVWSQGLISSGQPLSRWQSEHQLPEGGVPVCGVGVGSDYSVNGHTQKKINCQQPAMVWLLDLPFRHTHTLAASPLRWCSFCWAGFVDSSLEVTCLPSHMTNPLSGSLEESASVGIASMWESDSDRNVRNATCSGSAKALCNGMMTTANDM